VFTSRAGGVSTVPFDTMNLGSHVGDLPVSVDANRQLLKRATGVERVLYLLDQVHGNRVELLDPTTPGGQLSPA
jgi:copper oxidase (laccase) domain-containing protein